MAKAKGQRRDKFNVVNPSASVLIYNYNDRLGTKNSDANNPTAIDQIILNSASLISVSTSKSKSSPAGSFEIVLAPWKNWTTAITPGSWCVILMGRTPIKTSETKYNNPKVDKRHFKMLGRIESVRGVTTVDQATGTLTTSYVVTGTEWSTIFNSFLYVDPLARTKLDQEKTVANANRLIYERLVITDGKTGKEIRMRDSSAAIRGLMSFWGSTDANSSALKDLTNNEILAEAKNVFTMPKELVDYMGFTNLVGNYTNNVADILRFRGGTLVAYDKYSSVDNVDDATKSDGLGYIDPTTIFGMNTVWQIMTDNCNKPLNEMIPEIRWEGDKPLLTLYKRVKPFKIRTFEEMTEDNANVEDNSGANSAVDFLRNIASDYKNVRRYNIKSEDIITLNAGTNWRDRFNFIEVLLGKNIIPRFQKKDLFSTSLKKESQFYDRNSIQRDGFTPMTMTITYLPPNSKEGADEMSNYDLNKIYAYKYLGKEWYFDTHKMLNGSITIVGQDNYIQVGDNITFETKNLSSNQNINSDTLVARGFSYITAHVENISHRSTVSENGARSFITEIQFVRGIVSNINGDRLSPGAEQTLDQDATKIPEDIERMSDRVIGTSTGQRGKQDPDAQKMGHPGAS